MMDAMHSKPVAYWIAKYFNKGLRYRENTVCIDTRTFDLFMFKTSKKSITNFINDQFSGSGQLHGYRMVWSRFYMESK